MPKDYIKHIHKTCKMAAKGKKKNSKMKQRNEKGKKEERNKNNMEGKKRI